MDDIVIKVENLSKFYRLGELHKQTNSFREKVTQAFSRTFGRKASNAMPALWYAKPIPPGPHACPVGPEDRTGAPCSMPGEPDAIWALRNVSFEVKRGEIVGIIGRNGAGKTTLLKILSRITKPTEGRAWINGRVASLLEVGTGFHAELTGRENIFLNGAILGMTKAEISQKFDEIVDFAEVEKFIDTPVKRYSSGMYVRLAFAVAAHLEPEILLVDEVLAVGDAEFQKKCLGKMKDVSKRGRTVLFVSHNLGVIESLCSKGIYLKSGRIDHFGQIKKTIYLYLSSFQNINYYKPGVLFEAKGINKKSYQILKVTLLNKDMNPEPILKTWDYLRIRIKYYSAEVIYRGSIVLEIYTSSGNRLIQYSTKPLSGIDLIFRRGESHVDCVFPCFPLAEGNYRVAVGMAIPMTKWLYYEDNIATLEVAASDIYGSKFPPNQDSTPIAVEHYWEV